MHFFVFIGIVIIIIFLSILYFIFARRCNFKLNSIRNLYNGIPNTTDQLSILVQLSIKKVNGWNRITTYYTIFHYLLNTLSIVVSCISIYCSFLNKNNLSILFSIIAILSLTLNLFLRCERKWSTFRKVLAKGRIETIKFLSEIQNTKDIQKLTKEYACKIVEIESHLKDSELS